MVPDTPLSSPFACFSAEEHWSRRTAVVLGLVAASAAILVAATYVAGAIVAAEVSGTAVVDNPEYPGDEHCAPAAPGPTVTEGCDEPRTVERSASALAREQFGDAVGLNLRSFLLGWLLSGIGLHVVAIWSESDGTLRSTFAIASWAGVPLALASVGVLAVSVLALVSVDYAATDPAAVADASSTRFAEAQPLFLGFLLLGAGWSSLVWYAGLTGVHDLDPGRSLGIAGSLGLLGVVVAV